MRLALAFPGLLPFDPAESRRLLRFAPEAWESLAACDRFVRREAGWSILSFWNGERARPPVTRCSRCYVLVLSWQMALVDALIRRGLRPAAVVGISAGEPAAAYAAGILDSDDTLRVGIHTSLLVERLLAERRLAVVHASRQQVEDLTRDWEDGPEIAIEISPALTVVTGDREAVERLVAHAGEHGLGHTPVPFRFGVHHSRMEALRAPLLTALADIAPRPGRYPMLSGATGRWSEGGRDAGPEHWWLACSAPIDLPGTLGRLLDAGHRRVVEVGPRSLFSSALPHLGKGISVSLADDLLARHRAVVS